jgi:flagellar basal-body rod modification protein FlgD
MTAVTSSSTAIADQNAARLAQAASASTLNNPLDKKAESGSTAADTEDRFLKLLVAQMRNQDPLNPLDNAQVTTQLAQINTVRGIETLNTSVAKLVDRGNASSPLDAVGMLGRKVMVAGDRVDRAEGDAATRLGFELAGAGRRALAEVVDSTGKVVFSKTIDSPPAGVTAFEWNGADTQGARVPAGSYQLRVSATDGTKAISATALTPAQVIGVSQAADGIRLDLAGRAGVAASAVKAIL